MKIGIDLIPLKTYSVTRGIGKYSYDLVKAIIHADRVNRYFLYNVPRQLFNHFQLENVTNAESAAQPCDTDSLDLFIFTSIFELDYDILPDPDEIRCKKAVIMFDLIPVLFWEHYIACIPDSFVSQYFTRLAFVSQFDLIFAISTTTKNDLVDILEIPREKIIVIYSGLSECFHVERSNSKQVQQIKLKYGITRDYLLSTPAFDFRKNIFGIFESFSNLSSDLIEDLDLVLVCTLTPFQKSTLLNMWKDLKLPSDHLILTNYIPTNDLVVLYDGAKMFVFPSFYEGFGIPVLEAMSRECPVVASNVSSLPEVCENAALLVNPYNSWEISSAMDTILRNENVSKTLSALGYEQCQNFSWKKVAQRTLMEFERICPESRDSLRLKAAERNKIAFFTPLGHIHSILSHSCEVLLKELALHYDIDVFIEPDSLSDIAHLTDSVRIFPHTQFDIKKHEYDLFIYWVGNSKEHSYMLKYVFKYPGIVMLQDASLTSLEEDLCTEENRTEMDYERSPDSAVGNHFFPKNIHSSKNPPCHLPIDSLNLSLNLIKEISNKNFMIIVTYEFLKRFLESADGFSNVRFIPISMPPAEMLLANNECIIRDLHLQNRVIVTVFEKIGRDRRIQVLLHSLVKIVREYSIHTVHLVLAGPIEPGIRCEIEQFIHREQLENHITFTESIPYHDMEKFYSISHICVNLCDFATSEISAILDKALMHGIPVITSNIAQYRGYPGNCVWKVDIDLNEIDTLTGFLIELVTNRELRAAMSANSIQYARKNLFSSDMLSDYVSAINQVIRYQKKYN